MNQWSPQQDLALKAVDNWYKNERHAKQVFRLFGWAGTGKTTLAKHFASQVNGIVKFATYTGKAAHVMMQKGCPEASTIHRLIYRPKMMSKERLRDLMEQKDKLLLSRIPSTDILSDLHYLEEEIEKEQENLGRLNFTLNLDSDLRHANLLILDEVSMIDDDMGKDLESFGVPIIVLGDPEQLPPIWGAGYFTEQEPDIMLTEIHRQALDNPIIAMSKMVREGKPLPLGQYGSSRVISEKLDPEDILSHDIILTGLRKTKKYCDDRCRELKGFKDVLPMKGDRVMCVRNNHGIGILNGQMFNILSDTVNLGGEIVSIHVEDMEGGESLAISASEQLFKGVALRKWEHEEDIQEFEYAYAITVHKAQGSQWDNVLLFDQKEKFNRWSERDRRRWLYTGITRAAESVTVMRL